MLVKHEQESVLRVEGLRAGYGPLCVLHGIDICLKPEKFVLIIGRNGVGKTTFFRAVTLTDGVWRRGKLFLFNREITYIPPHQLRKLGVGYFPQGRRIFRSLTVHEHLLLARKEKEKGGGNSDKKWDIATIYTLFPELKARRKQLAARLSGGEQTMLSIARALVTEPQVLLLDEPSEGLAPAAIRRLLFIYNTLKHSKINVIMAEQNILFIEVADELLIMSNGKIIYQNEIKQIPNIEEVIRQYAYQ